MARNYSVRFVLFVLSLGVINPVFAEILGDWQLLGKYQVTAAITGKNQSFKQNDLGGITALFSRDGGCLINVGSVSITGGWAASKRNFKTQLSLSSANALLKVIEKDLAAKSGMQVVMDADKLTLTGTERKNGTIKGRLKIKAKTLFLDYGYKKGALSMSYDFIGTRINADEGQMLTTVD